MPVSSFGSASKEEETLDQSPLTLFWSLSKDTKGQVDIWWKWAFQFSQYPQAVMFKWAEKKTVHSILTRFKADKYGLVIRALNKPKAPALKRSYKAMHAKKWDCEQKRLISHFVVPKETTVNKNPKPSYYWITFNKNFVRESKVRSTRLVSYQPAVNVD